MRVKLIAYTAQPELLSAAAAKLCYNDISIDEVIEKLTPEKIEHLLQLVISSGHHSVIEHVNTIGNTVNSVLGLLRDLMPDEPEFNVVNGVTGTLSADIGVIPDGSTGSDTTGSR